MERDGEETIRERFRWRNKTAWKRGGQTEGKKVKDLDEVERWRRGRVEGVG